MINVEHSAIYVDSFFPTGLKQYKKIGLFTSRQTNILSTLQQVHGQYSSVKSCKCYDVSQIYILDMHATKIPSIKINNTSLNIRKYKRYFCGKFIQNQQTYIKAVSVQRICKCERENTGFASTIKFYITNNFLHLKKYQLCYIICL